MAFPDLLNHRSDIYHILREDSSPGFNLPKSPVFHYPDSPDVAAVPCHFSIRQVSATVVVQGDPNARYDARIKAAYPLGTDIRLNDKVVDLANGYEYTAEVPRVIRDHHISVYLHRTGVQGVL